MRFLKLYIFTFLLVVLPGLVSEIGAQEVNARTSMREVFIAMPDSVLPTVTKNNRLDCVDFIENNIEAKVRNVFDEYVTLEVLTADYARFRTSTSSLLELKLLPTSDTTSVLCIVTTAQLGEENNALRLEDSNIRFANADWSPLSADALLIDKQAFAKIDDFLGVQPEEAIPGYEQALRSLADFHPVRIALSPVDTSLTLTLQTGQLSKEEREAVSRCLQPVKLMWNGQRFTKAISE